MEFARAIALTSVFVIALTLTSQAWAESSPRTNIQSTDSIRGAVREFLEQVNAPSGDDFEISVGHVDRRLRMPKCNKPLQAFAAPGQTRGDRATVGVRCTSERPWKLYVSARIQTFDDVVVSARPLSRGDVIMPGDLTRQRRDISRLRRTYFTDPKLLVGRHLRRSVTAGQPLSARWLNRPVDVRRGQRVVLLAQVSGLQVRMEGTALSNAQIGDLIKVRNLRSNRVVEGVVNDAGTVMVAL
ncbi:MAG: flagella basal body P-ring formation protein FlgA [Gammaproteobacteria bacterium]